MKKLMYIAAALLVLVGCNNKENVIENAPQNLVTITGGIDFSAQDGPNKVVAKDGWENVTSGNKVEFMWEEGDKIAILNMDMTEVKQFTVSSLSQDGTTATFTGEPLSGGMESYIVWYPYEVGVLIIQQQGRISGFFTNQQYTGKLRPVCGGAGANDSFTISNFISVIDLSLTGSVKLGKIIYYIANGQDQPEVTLSFGDGGFQLTDQPQHVTFIPSHISSEGFTLKFYDTDDQLIMEKTSTKLLNGTGIIFSFPTLEVKAAAPTPDPKDIFDEGAKMNFEFDRYGNHYEFNYTNNGSDFTCDKIIQDGKDATTSLSGMCTITLPGDYTFQFNLGPMFTLDYDGANKTYKRSGNFGPDVTFTDFKVNDVSIFDQLTDITE